MCNLKQEIRIFNPIIIIIFAAFILRIWGINHNFPDVNRYFYETEEYPSVQIAMGFGGGDLNPYSFNKPSLYYYLLFGHYGFFYLLGKALGFFNNLTDFVKFYFNSTWIFYLIGRLLSVIFGVASIYMAYRIGREIFDRKVAIITSAMLAITPIHVEFSQQALPDILGLFLSLASVYFSLLAYKNFSLKNLILSSIFAGLALSSKYHYGFIILALFVIIFMQASKERRAKYYYFKIILICLLLFILAFIIGTPFAVLDYKYFLRSILELEKAKAGSSVLLGHRENIPNWWIEHLFQLARPNTFGIGMLFISILGVFFAFIRHTWKYIVLLSIVLFFYAFFSVSKWIWSPAHYLLVIIPYLLLLGNSFVVDSFSKLKINRLSQIILFLIIALPPFITVCINDNLNSYPDTKSVAKKWIESNIVKGSKILMDKFYVPQLSLTEDTLERFTAERISEDCKLLPSYRAIESKNKYTYLRDKSLTQIGKPYNIYLIYSNNMHDIEEYKKKNNIEYIILSGEAKKIYLDIFPFNIDRGNMLGFYDSVKKKCTLIKEFKPNWRNLPGPEIEIYRVN